MRLLLGPTTCDLETILEVRPGTQTQDPKSGSQELIPGTRLRSGIQDSRLETLIVCGTQDLGPWYCKPGPMSWDFFHALDLILKELLSELNKGT